jgi:hypothetical protein
MLLCRYGGVAPIAAIEFDESHRQGEGGAVSGPGRTNASDRGVAKTLTVRLIASCSACTRTFVIASAWRSDFRACAGFRGGLDCPGAANAESLRSHQMSIKFEQPVEAFLAVASVAIGADGIGSLEERNALFGRVKNLDVFKSMSESEFRKLLGDVTDRVYTSLPMDDGTFSSQAIDELVSASKAVLSAEQQKAAYEMAVDLCGVDEQAQAESAFLEQLKRGLAA